MPSRYLLCLSFLPLLAGATGCKGYDSPPKATVVEAVDGILQDASAPLQIAFHEPVVRETLSVKLIRYETDAEGNLYDEDDDPETELDIFFEYPGPDGPDFPVGGEGAFSDDSRVFTIDTTGTLPIGPQLALLIEPGLADAEGNEWKVRQTLKFGYNFSCGGEGDQNPTAFPDAVHFMVVDVDAPISTQLQLLASMRVDPDTGAVVGQFTNADRDPAISCAPFGLSCDGTEACRTLPMPACVPPSEGAGTADEYPDFTFNDTPPTGYSFTVLGCVRDEEDGSFTFANAPVDVKVQSPPVTVIGINFNGSFAFDGDGILRGAGTFSSADVLLGTSSSGAGAGTLNSRVVPPEEVPAGTPSPPEGAAAP
ncbi:MAG: hypothetical protein R3B72_46270 [Polyangiaceae bacterium]